ncbi:MAG: hypothetical protein RL095_3314 [Verrucomicrobiota bacterium]|jgi:carbamoyl-phosphate synthase large subunit
MFIAEPETPRSQSMNLFFLNVGRRCELVRAFARSLPRFGSGLIWGSDPNPLAPALAEVDRIVELPSPQDCEAYVAALGAFLARERIGLLIPTIDPDLLRLDRWSAQLQKAAPDCRILLSSSEAIAVARDKRRSREAFACLGAEVPQALDPADPELRFPIFVKPAAGSASQGARTLHNRAELEAALADTQDPMFEALVEGEETTVDVLLDFLGKALVAIPRRRLQVRGGEVTRGILERDAGLESLACRLAEGLGCRGPVTLQFRQPAPGRWVAMELNARLGGGLPLSLAAGADWPGWILQLCRGETPDCSRPVLDRLVISRFDDSLFIPPAKSLPPPRPAGEPLPPLLIFDMDDTLFPEADFVRSGHRAAAAAAWAELGIDIEPELRRRFAAGQRGDLFSSSLRALGVEPPPGFVEEVLVPAYREHRPEIRPFLETAVLGELRQRGHLLALLSDGWAAVQRRKFEALGLAPLFDAAVFTDELGGPSAWKPSPAGFEELLRIFEMPAAKAVYIADNPHKDFIAPRRLGMGSLRIVRPGGEHAKAVAAKRADDADFLIRSLNELL